VIKKVHLNWIDRLKKALSDNQSDYFKGFFISPFRFFLSTQEYEFLTPLEIQHSVEISEDFLLDLYDKTAIARVQQENFLEYTNKDDFVKDLKNGLSLEKMVFVVPEFKVFIELRASFEILILFFEEDERIATKIIFNLKDSQYVIKDFMGVRFKNSPLFSRKDFTGLSKITHQENQYIWFLFSDLIKAIECDEFEECNPRFISVFDHWLNRDEVKEKLDCLTENQHMCYTKRILGFFKIIHEQHPIYIYTSSRLDKTLIKNESALEFYIDNTYDKNYKDKLIFLVPSLSIGLMLSEDHTLVLFCDELDGNAYLCAALKNSNLYILDESRL